MSYVIEGFESLSKQQMFDMALAHIRSTRIKSVNSLGSGTYSGSGCAASVFLTERGKQELSDCWMTHVSMGDVPDHEASFVQALQTAHDMCASGYPDDAFMECYENAMRATAIEYRLHYKPEAQ